MVIDKTIESVKTHEDKFVDVIDETVSIDRYQEDAAVEEFQKTGDLKILEEVYKARIPTIRSWANKHYYPGLTFSVDDLFSDFSVVFVKAAEKYNRSRGAFNTCLFTFLLNRLKNIKNSKHAKKRLSEEYSGPAVGMILSLDYSYNTSDGSEVTLKDVIPSDNPTETDYVLTNTYMDETLNVLSNNDENFKQFLSKIGDGNSLVSLIREYKTRQGTIKLSSDDAKRFSSRKCNRLVTDLIKDKISDDFKLLGYKIEGTSHLRYEVELKRTEETDKFMKSLREIRKNKESYMDKLERVC
jgi:hypothetical protein